MRKIHFIAFLIMLASLMLNGCGGNELPSQPSDDETEPPVTFGATSTVDSDYTDIDSDVFGTVTAGTETYREFIIDNVLHSPIIVLPTYNNTSR